MIASDPHATLELVRPVCVCHGESMIWNKRTRSPHGGYWKCAVIHRERRRAWRKAHLEAERTRDRLWRASHPEFQRRYRETHRELVREHDRLRQRAHPEKGTDKERRRRALKAGVPTDGHSRAEVFDRDGGTCQICSTSLDPRNWHEDHIVPLVAGGPDMLENVQATCPPCNLSKGATVAA